MTEKNTLAFNELDLDFGQTLQIHPNVKSNELFDCKLVGCLEGEAVIVTVTEVGEFPVLSEGQQISIRVLLPSGVALFPTTVLLISDMPTFMVYLDFPKAIRFKQVRTAPRVDVNLPVLISSRSKSGARGVVAQIIDLSTTGARLQTSDPLGDLGETIEIKGKFKVASVQRMVTIDAIIRSRSRTKKGFNIYGLQFVGMEDDEKLIFLFGFIFSEIAFGRLQHVK